MKTFRKTLFWLHLAAGVTAGAVILVMSLTGVLLTYERQLIEWSDSHFQSQPDTESGALGPSALLDRIASQNPDLAVTALTFRANPESSVIVTAGTAIWHADAHSGQLLGQASTGVRQFMSTLRGWHRWLAIDGENRNFARAITGWSNVLFLFIVLSGMYLWLPAIWSMRHVRAVAWFKGGLQGKARDFNWHNAIGIWSAVPLAIVVATAMPISFPWANAAVYRLMGEEPPAPAAAGGGARQAAASVNAASANTAARARVQRSSSIDEAWARASTQIEGWRSINFRLPSSESAPVAFTVDLGNGGQPHLRSTVTVDVAKAAVRVDSFSDQTPGRRLRSWSRFTHTGEYYGIVGQTIAGIVTAGAVVLVWTGIALALRRFAGWVRSSERPAARRAA